MFLSLTLKAMSSIVFFIILARVVNVETFGNFMFYYSVATIVVLLIDYGYSITLIKDLTKNPTKTAEIINISFISKVVLSSIILIFSVFISSGNYLFTVIILALTFDSFNQFFCFGYRAIDKFKLETKVSTISTAIHVITIIPITLISKDIQVITLTFLFTKCLGLIYSHYIFRKEYNFNKFRLVKKKILLGTLSTNFPYMIHILIGTLYMQVDTILIKSFLGDENVGLYQGPARILAGGIILVNVFNSVFLPRFSSVKGNKSKLISLSKKMRLYTLSCGFLISSILYLFSYNIITLLFGIEYAASSNVLKIMAVVLMIRFFSSQYGTILTISNRQKLRAGAVSVALVINALSNIILIPHYGLEGAAISLLITVLFILFIYMLLTYFELKKLLLDRSTVMILVSFLTLIILERMI